MKKIIAKATGIVVLATMVLGVCAGCNKAEEDPTAVLVPVVNITTEAVTEATPAPTETQSESVSISEATESEPAQTLESEEVSSNEEVTSEEESVTEPATDAPETQAQVSGDSKKPWDLLNDEPLNPTLSGYPELDNLLAAYMQKFVDEGYITEGMSNYQTVRAIYVWYIKNIFYNRGMNVDAGKYSSSDPATTPEEVLWATDLFNTGQGCCYNYSSSFMYLMRYIGFDAHIISGQVSSYGGGTTPHCWVYMNLGGKAYTFDPDVDMNFYWRDINAGSTEPRTDVLFCKPMDEMGYFYTPEKYHEN